MIELQVEPYCHGCSEFEVKVKSCEVKNTFGDVKYANHYIKCVHRHKCRKMMEHLKTKVSEQSAN